METGTASNQCLSRNGFEDIQWDIVAAQNGGEQ